MKKGQFSRRDFFHLCLGGGLLAASYPLARVLSQVRSPRPSQQQQAHRPTPDNTLGPYYRTGAPRTERLEVPGGSSTPLLVAGLIINTDGAALPNSKLEVFHADQFGDYDMAGFRCRGEIPVGADGRYRYETVMPGQYGGRAQHIHYVITAPGHRQLVTQLYFETDPKFDGNPDKNYTRDGLVQHRELIRPVEAARHNNAAYSSVTFDICLEKA
jgi:protocatechuate 3,4-dioxygenase beta subunit